MVLQVGLDKKLINKRFSSHFATYQANALVQKEVCLRLSAALQRMSLTPSHALEIGAGTGLLTSHLFNLYPNSNWIVNDLSLSAKPFLEGVVARSSLQFEPSFLFGDAEQIEFPAQLDLVASASTIQWFEDISAFIASLPLVSGGVAAFSTFLPGTFSQIAAVSGTQGLEYLTKEELEAAFAQNGYRVEYVEEFSSNLTFATPLELLRHLKLTGVNSIKRVSWNKTQLESFCSSYIAKFSVENGVLLTYKPIIIIATKL